MSCAGGNTDLQLTIQLRKQWLITGYNIKSKVPLLERFDAVYP